MINLLYLTRFFLGTISILIFWIADFKLLRTKKLNRPKFNFMTSDAQGLLSSLKVYRACCCQDNILGDKITKNLCLLTLKFKIHVVKFFLGKGVYRNQSIYMFCSEWSLEMNFEKNRNWAFQQRRPRVPEKLLRSYRNCIEWHRRLCHLYGYILLSLVSLKANFPKITFFFFLHAPEANS